MPVHVPDNFVFVRVLGGGISDVFQGKSQRIARADGRQAYFSLRRRGCAGVLQPGEGFPTESMSGLEGITFCPDGQVDGRGSERW